MNAGTVIVQDGASRWFLFERPVGQIVAAGPQDVPAAVAEVETQIRRGRHAAGFLCYEAAPGFDRALRTRPASGLPVAWMGIYPPPVILNRPPASGVAFEIGPWEAATDRGEYLDRFDRIRRYLVAGDTYQVNYSIRLHSRFLGDPYGLFSAVVPRQRPGHAAFVRIPRYAICSASPELFFRQSGDRVVCRPMKGTAERGLTWADDQARAGRLHASPKERAENVMIVDMIRNDLGRVARPGTVWARRRFVVERYPTVLQMTSVVTAATRATPAQVLAALFPCASVTGAPKCRTMEIIAETETSPRGVYCGAIGYMAPGRRANFNVAIRTVAIDEHGGLAECGAGGGIVSDSTGEDEYRECLAKTLWLTARRDAFVLVETLRWDPTGGFVLLETHLARMRDSARYFRFPFPERRLRQRLHEAVADAGRDALRVRLTLSETGRVAVAATAAPGAPERPLRVGLARTPVRRDDVILYHKTSDRRTYERALAERPDCDDVLLFNEDGEVTETSIANVVFEFDGVRCTPPVACGLLAGTLRASLLAEGRIVERVIAASSLTPGTRFWALNSVRGWVPAELV